MGTFLRAVGGACPGAMEVFEQVDAYFEGLGGQSGLGGDQIKYLVCLLAAIPLGWLFAALPPRKNLRMAFGMLWGLIFCFFCLGRWAWMHSFFTAVVTWLIMRFGPHQHTHNIVFVFLMGYMSLSHIY